MRIHNAATGQRLLLFISMHNELHIVFLVKIFLLKSVSGKTANTRRNSAKHNTIPNPDYGLNFHPEP